MTHIYIATYVCRLIDKGIYYILWQWIQIHMRKDINIPTHPPM